MSVRTFFIPKKKLTEHTHEIVSRVADSHSVRLSQLYELPRLSRRVHGLQRPRRALQRPLPVRMPARYGQRQRLVPMYVRLTEGILKNVF